MRAIIIFTLTISFLNVDAQIPSTLNFTTYPQQSLLGKNIFENTNNKKWFLSSYSSISTGFYFFNGNFSNYLAAPLGLQLNRELNKNIYAFAGISAAPVYFNHVFLSSDINKVYPNGLYNQNSFGIYSRAELGLMYVNDAKTFSISGSFSVQRGSNPYLPYYQPTNGKKNNLIMANK